MSLSDLAISVRGVSKAYTITKNGERHDTLAETVLHRLRDPFQRAERETFWALKDVSFDVKKGEIIGIIGRNGAGKSTLLKIMSRITEPTSGQIDLYGRIGSLLEVGTGFHPELTGRENIYLNGQILGMRCAEIDRHFDAIVGFAEIEKFLDTPVKRYSSGMYVRLAFAVAAHLEPEILIVDEVLAVGDAAFQRKCLGKIGDVARHGRTVLFVSHNMGAISSLCTRAIELRRGEIATIGPTSQVVASYMSGNATCGIVDLSDVPTRTGDGAVRFTQASLHDDEGAIVDSFNMGDTLTLRASVKTLSPVGSVKLAVELATADGLKLANMVDVDSGFSLRSPNAYEEITLRLDDVRLYPGTYLLSLWAGHPSSLTVYDYVEGCLQFEVIGGGRYTSRPLPRQAGIMFLTPSWTR